MFAEIRDRLSHVFTIHERGRLGLIAAILFLSLLLRVGCAVWFSGMTDGEGAEYARIAQNLLAGVGYVGIATKGEQLFFPPLFPLLISTITLLTGDAEIAGRIVSIIFGSLVVVPTYLIANRLYGERVAVGAAALVGIHPFLVYYSTTVFSEPTFLTIVLAAIYSAMRSMDNLTPRGLFITGVLYGLAYLVRQEALAYMLIATGFVALHIAIKAKHFPGALFARLPIMFLAFTLLTGPYVAWLSGQTGQLTIQGKGSFNLPTEKRIQEGLSEYDAAFGVDPDLTKRGIWLQSNLAAIKGYNINTRELFVILIKRAKKLIKHASATIAGSLEFGSPVLFGLAVLGLFSRPWKSDVIIAQLHLLTVLALALVSLLFTYVFHERFYFMFLPFLSIWGTFGLVVFGQWARQSAAEGCLSQIHQAKLASASQVLAVLGVLLPSAALAAGHFKQDRSSRVFKQAIIALSNKSPSSMRMASTSTPLAFHARAEFVWLPYSDGSTARRYLAKANVTHVLLWGSDVMQAPYLAKWMHDGVPGARQVVDVTSITKQRLKIYELDK